MKHQGITIWLTGLSGAGKTTIANHLSRRLREKGAKVEVLDADVTPSTNLSKGLRHTRADRDTNIRRIGFVCGLLSRNGVIVIAAAISPYRKLREEIRATTTNFVEVFADCDLETLVRRDVKGLYKRALAGLIKNLPGVSDPYEAPLHPEVRTDSGVQTVDESVSSVWNHLVDAKLIEP